MKQLECVERRFGDVPGGDEPEAPVKRPLHHTRFLEYVGKGPVAHHFGQAIALADGVGEKRAHVGAVGDLRLVDGGVVNNSPISRAAELGAERIYLLPTGEPGHRRLECAPKTALDAAIHGVQLLVNSRLEADIARYAPAVELVVLPAPNPRGVQPTSFEHPDRLTQGARVAARATLASQTVETPLRLVG